MLTRTRGCGMELPIVAPAPAVADQAAVFRDLFENQCQFRHFQHYLTGLIVLPNKSIANIARCPRPSCRFDACAGQRPACLPRTAEHPREAGWRPGGSYGPPAPLTPARCTGAGRGHRPATDTRPGPAAECWAYREATAWKTRPSAPESAAPPPPRVAAPGSPLAPRQVWYHEPWLESSRWEGC